MRVNLSSDTGHFIFERRLKWRALNGPLFFQGDETGQVRDSAA